MWYKSVSSSRGGSYNVHTIFEHFEPQDLIIKLAAMQFQGSSYKALVKISADASALPVVVPFHPTESGGNGRAVPL